MHNQKKKSRVLLFGLSVLILSFLFSAIPVFAEEQTKTDYDAYYVSGAKVFWDAFDRETGDTHNEADAALFKTAGTFGDGYLSVQGQELNFTSAFENDGKTDYTLDLTVAMQNSSSTTIYLGALSGFSLGINHGISKTDQFPVDASYGIISNTYRALKGVNGNTVQVATDVGWRPVRFIGAPLGKVYSFAVSADYHVGESEKDSVDLTLFRDSAAVQTAALLYPVNASNSSVAVDTSVFKITASLNYRYYSLRYYEKVLTEAELAQNHFIDLCKYFGVSLANYDTYDIQTREELHFALREVGFDMLTKSALQSTVDTFGTLKMTFDVADAITFDGFSAAIYGAPGLRALYTVDKSVLHALEAEGYQVTVGALVAVKGDRTIESVTKDTEEKTLVREVYKNGELINSIVSEDAASFTFALTARYDGESSEIYYESELYYRAFLTIEREGVCESFYLDAEGDSFGNSVSIQKLSLLLAFLGQTEGTAFKEVLGEELLSLAKTVENRFADLYGTKAESEALSENVADYLAYAYRSRAEILENTGVDKNTGVYNFDSASPYYKLFTSMHTVRDLAGYSTETYLLQCENACAVVNYAADTVADFYNRLLEEQSIYADAESVFTFVLTSAQRAGFAEDDLADLISFLRSCIEGHGKTVSDAVRDVTVAHRNLQDVQSTVASQTEALTKLRRSLFTKNDRFAFDSFNFLSSYVILTDEENQTAALLLSNFLSDQYGIHIPYFTSFPENAQFAHTITVLGASTPDLKALLGDHAYLIKQNGSDALICARDISDLKVAVVSFTRGLTSTSVTLKEESCEQTFDLFNTDLPTYLASLDLSTVEDGGVMERFRIVLSELPSELSVVQPLSSVDYPLSFVNTVYVSPNGDDKADGSYERPFKTVAHAVSYAQGKGGAQIVLFGGTYKIEETLSFTAGHSGSKHSPLYITAMPGEEVIFTTADTLYGSHFTSVTDEAVIQRLNTFTQNNHEKVYVADLAALGITEYGKISTSGEPLLIVDDTLYDLARYPNKDEALIQILTANSVLKQSQVTTGSSSLYKDHNTSKETVAGWKYCIDGNSLYKDRIEKWTWTDGQNTAESIWLHGALYEEWHRAHYPLVIAKEDVNGAQTVTVSSTVNCPWGLKTTDSHLTKNNGYFYNILEELDADGEWYLDHRTGKLYIYASDGIAENTRISLVSGEYNLVTVENSSNIIFNGITFAETLGIGVFVSQSENILIQNCTFHDTRNNALRLKDSYNSGVIASDFSRSSATMVAVQGTNDRATMTPDRLFVQNCHFHDPLVQTAVQLTGISCLVSHNFFEDTTVTFGGAECILEYNRFARGSQITYDSGPIYCSGPYNPKGNHIRYNYLYDLNFSLYGIYIDDLSSDNYVYSNIIVYAESMANKSTKCVNIHNGHQNVVYNNICVNAQEAAIRDNANYYTKEVTYMGKFLFWETEKTLDLKYKAYTTASDGTQSVSEKTGSGGGLGYRWPSLMGEALDSYRKIGGDDSRLAERFPNLAIYMGLVEKQIADSKANTSYSYDKAKVDWTFTEKDGQYAWGDMSLREFLLSAAKQELELYVRSSAFNEYRNNVFLGCKTDVFVYSQWGILTTAVENNYGFTSSSEFYQQAMSGDLTQITQAETWEDVIDGFESIPYERIGYRALCEVRIFCETNQAD